MPDNNKIILGTNDDTYIAADDAGNIVLQHEGGNRISMNNTSITPASNEQIDLGSATNKFRDLYLSSDSIFIGDTKLSSDPSTGALTTAVANGQGGFSAATGVGPLNVNSTSTTATLVAGDTFSGGNNGGLALSPYTNNKVQANGSLLTLGNNYSFLDIGTEFTWTGKGCRMASNPFGSAGPLFEDINGNFMYLNYVILPGNIDVDTSLYGDLHNTMSAANFKWKLEADLQFGSLSLQLVNTSGVAQDWNNTRVVAVGEYLSGGQALIPGGINFNYLLDQIGQGNLTSINANPNSGLGHHNDITWQQVQNTFELTNSAVLRVTIEGTQYELHRSTDGSGTAILAQV